MQAEKAAQIFHDWAEGEGLLPDGPVAPVTSAASDFGLIQSVTNIGKQILRSKQIQAISFNESANEVIVFFKRAAPASKKQIQLLPQTIDDVQVLYRQGIQHAIDEEQPIQAFGGPPYTVRQSGTSEYYACGSSVSVGNFREAGTLGCLVRDAKGVLHGLSNNHVTGGCSFAGAGLPILAPGVADVAPGFKAPFTIGFHAQSLPFIAGAPDNVNHKKNFDAAIFRIVDETLVSSHQGDAYDTPSQAGLLIPGIEVEKVGRTTQHTKGRVIGQIYGASPIRYSAALYEFAGSVYLEPLFLVTGLGQAFSDNGDSGSLVTTMNANGERIAVGIIVGGRIDAKAPGGKISVVAPILPILQGLGVTLVAGHNI